MQRRRILEIFCWSVGLLRLAFYVTTRARQRAVAARVVRDFHESRNVQSARTAPGAPSAPIASSSASLPRQEPQPALRQLSWGTPDQSLWSPVRVRAWEAGPQPSTGHALAVLRIPRIGLEVPVFEGTDDATLDLGLGHVEGTAGLDAPGNVALAGHRDGFFRVLKDVGAGDEIDMETQVGMRRYVVKDIVIVKPDDVWVLDDNSAALTLVTCYPFYYTGSAPQRYIVRASEQPRTP
jgi:sortase A